MRALDKKLVRDLKRLWAQGLAIALVLACGVATLILAIGSYRSLDETRAAYYDRHKFANVFATATRAPRTLTSQIRRLPGVLSVEARIAETQYLEESIGAVGRMALDPFLRVHGKESWQRGILGVR